MKLLYRICWLILRFYMWLFCKLKILGAKNIPRKEGMIVAANHIGAADPFFVGACINRELYFLAKKELFKNFFLRTFISHVNAIPVDRTILDRSALQAAETALRQGYGLILFPEGTRSRSGELKKGKPGVGLLARKLMVPILPAYIKNSRGFATLLLKRKRLKVRFGEPLDVERISLFPDDKEGYRAITEEVMDRIARLHEGE